jgi:DNA-binding MarR family transcriptional regulator
MTHFVLDDSVGFLINRTALFLKRELQQAFRRQGLSTTAEQWAVLNRLWEQQGLSQVQLAERTFKDKPNMTRMLDVLQKDGLVVRRQDDRDRRAYQVFLTTEGQRLRQDMVPVVVEVLDRALSGLEVHRVHSLKSILSHIDRNLD